MKIECDKCSAKYSIADEKVRGKTFKIRCKKCSNVIIVRDKVAAAVAGGGGAEAAPDQTHPGWHLAINGETVGPMSEDDVRARYDAGEIDKDTAIWQEGFEDWIPLGDVEGFADLPDRVGPTGDDPFASANQDDYAAAGGMAAAVQQPAAAVGADPYGHQPLDEPHSPRVSSLTGQRNENSVLFSLDSLQALATGGGGAAARAPSRGPVGPGNARTGTKGLATVAPGSEGSGLIDIRALGAMVGSDSPAQTAGSTAGSAVDDAALPSFGGSGLGGLVAAPLVPQPMDGMGAAAAAAAAQPPARSNAPLYAMMAVLILAVVGLGVYIVIKPPAEPVIVTQENPDAPSVKGVGADEEDDDKDEDEDEDEDKDKDKDKDDEDDKDEDAEKEEGGDEEGDEEEGDEDGTLADGTKSRSKGKGKKGKSSGKGSSSKSPLDGFPSGSSTPDPKPKETPKSTKGSELDVDCILDPKACGKGKSTTKKPAPTGATDPSLPEKLSTTDIRAGIDPVKGSAKSCGGRHGAKPGEKVKVKLSISGATGAVTNATAQAPHTGTPLGNCVASALKKAKFKKFRKASLGAVYPVTM